VLSIEEERELLYQKIEYHFTHDLIEFYDKSENELIYYKWSELNTIKPEFISNFLLDKTSLIICINMIPFYQLYYPNPVNIIDKFGLESEIGFDNDFSDLRIIQKFIERYLNLFIQKALEDAIY
jgi:hypothetical protein